MSNGRVSLVRLSLLACVFFAASDKAVTQVCKPKYPNGATAIDRGRDPKTDESHCRNNCAAGPLRIDPSPALGNIGQDLAINFRLDKILGGPNAVCGSNGKVDWGDGTTTDMPSDPWRNCDGNASGMLHDTVGKPPNYTLHHKYGTAGEYCLSAYVWGNHKYHGDGSCSYDCQVQGDIHVSIRDTLPKASATKPRSTSAIVSAK